MSGDGEAYGEIVPEFSMFLWAGVDLATVTGNPGHGTGLGKMLKSIWISGRRPGWKLKGRTEL